MEIYMIKLDDNSYIVGIWFSEDPETGHNWMATVIADPNKSGFFKIYSRTRYHKDNKIFDSNDEKNWINASSKEGQTEDQIINITNHLQSLLRVFYKNLDKLIVQGNLEKLIDLSFSKPWLNFKMADLNDTEH
jgi:hypothetical protein